MQDTTRRVFCTSEAKKTPLRNEKKIHTDILTMIDNQIRRKIKSILLITIILINIINFYSQPKHCFKMKVAKALVEQFPVLKGPKGEEYVNLF